MINYIDISSLAKESGGHLASLDTKFPSQVSGGIPVTLSAGTVTALTPYANVGVTGTVTANAGTNLNTSLLALEAGGNLATLVARTPALGTAAVAASVPVAIASDQIVPAKGSFTEAALVHTPTVGLSVLASTDVSAFKWVSVQLSGTWVGTLAWQGSNDNTNWSAITLTNIGIGTTTGAISATAAGIFHGAVAFRYLRIQVSAYTSGTFAGTVEFYTAPTQYQTLGVSGPVTQSGVWSTSPIAINSGGATSTKYVAAASTNLNIVKSSNGQIYGVQIYNAAAYPIFLKFFQKTTNPTLGTDSVYKTIACLAGAIVNIDFPVGLVFTPGIAIAITKLMADSDTTVLVANDCIVNIDWK